MSQIDKLVKMANDKTSWKNRMEALEKIKEIDCQQRKDVIIRLSLHDRVFAVKEEACRVANRLNITKNGKPIKLGKKNIGFKPKDFNKTFARIQREGEMDEFDLEKFKKRFINIHPEMYDVMSFEKKDNFNKWIENIYKGLPKKS